MTDLDALLAGIVADPHNAVRWLVMADWLEDHGFPERAELVRVHRELLRTCTDPDAHPERPQLHARMMELMRAGVQPCLPQRTITLPGGVELRMSFIPPGSFLMGSPETEEEREDNETRHLVTLTRGFWMGQTPVTQSQWMAVMRENPSHDTGTDLPVESVSWSDVQEFCRAVEEATGSWVRRPTEAEWEYAARAGTTTPFYWGSELDGTQANCNGEVPYGTNEMGDAYQTASPVGRYARISPHPWLLQDTAGNVWEWCADKYSRYPDTASVDPLGPQYGGGRVVRGGCYWSDAALCRAAQRHAFESAEWEVGFRVACTVSKLE